MEIWHVAIAAAGTALMIMVLIDVALTAIHPDLEGVLAKQTQRGVWAVAVRVPAGAMRRRVQALAGPAMIAATFIMWVFAFILGFALVVYPFIDDAYRAEPELSDLGFLQALYYSGVTVTVLGYGDITPVTWPLQLATFAASATGFVLLTGIVTYVIQVVTALNERVHLALRLDDDTGGSADGTELILNALTEEGIVDTRRRLEELGDMIRDIDDRLHRLPMVALCYRFADPRRDPEPAFEAAFEAAVAARLVSTGAPYGRLAPAARSLHRASHRLIMDVSGQHLNKSARDELEAGPDDDARAELEMIRDRIATRTRVAIHDDALSDDLADFVYRSRRFLHRLDMLTRWRGPASMRNRP
ncbi:potassium channel family protein [Phytoactinopolyspora halotolerans]|uniref:Two pore domain potassium channel family protein n=1 Tax=Phytoactinopolyspora halotolerans TaxID=1981512 RepID=A0A6L9SBT3_9ACTN|nr:potassium channel family protein [Phytoactinopolyspora halotolerans]NEE02062.1 two pore domain potassium channel family protein [Phytoactinopolyspora halotolerans]